MATLDFQEKVIQRSFEIPVVVDFWAAWCGPCRTLGPVITAMSQEAEGKWELVKVDTEANQEIAQEYQIMSIPAVKMFYKGEMIAEFAGALPKLQIQQWLDTHLPSEAKEEMNTLMVQLREVPSRENLEKLISFNQEHPDSTESISLQHWFTAVEAKEESMQWLQQQAGNPNMLDTIQDIRALMELGQTDAKGSDSFVNAWRAGKKALQSLEMEEAMKHFVQTVMLHKKFKDELPRRVMISLFHMMGETHPLTKKYRPMFSMALY